VAASNIERVTMFARRFEGRPLVIVRTKKAYDAAALRKATRTTRELKASGKTFFAAEDRYSPTAVWPVDEKTFVISDMRALVPYLAAIEKAAKTHVLADELEVAAGKHAVTIALLPSLMFRTSVARETRWSEGRKDGFKKDFRKDGPRKEIPKDGFKDEKKERFKDKDKGVRAEFLRVQFKDEKKDGRPPFRDKDGFKPKPLEVSDIKEEELKLKTMEECYDHVDRWGPMSAIFRPYVRCRRFVLTFDVDAEIKANAKATFLSEADAKDGLVAGKMALILIRDALPLMLRYDRDIDIKSPAFSGVLSSLQSGLRGAEVKRDGKTVEASASAKLDTVALGKWAEEQLPIMQDRNNLKQIGIAFHAYSNSQGFMPPQAICDVKGKPLLSWRVAILPYIEQQDLYRKFKLDEPWDSPHNKKLLPLMPKIYAPVAGAAAEPDSTFYQVFTGEGTIYTKPDVRRRIYNITDGTSNTFMVAEAHKGVPWTKPEDMVVTAKSLPKLGGQFKGFFNVAFCDGSVRRIKLSTKESTLRAYITPDGGEVIPRDE
jgi:prepilin-type processing-associated H-X9-DG protein